jgi:2-dehydropantoate 2-reductase
MNFVIVGAGALGSIYAAYLARAGHEVSLIARGERAAALARHGFVVESAQAFDLFPNTPHVEAVVSFVSDRAAR